MADLLRLRAKPRLFRSPLLVVQVRDIRPAGLYGEPERYWRDATMEDLTRTTLEAFAAPASHSRDQQDA